MSPRPCCRFAVAGVLLALAACAPEPDPAYQEPTYAYGHGYWLQVKAGPLQRGGGSAGLAVVATMRDRDGKGPELPWAGRIRGGNADLAAGFVYDSPGPGSLSVWTFDAIEPRQAGTFYLELTNGEQRLEQRFEAGEAIVDVPLVELDAAGSRLSWSKVAAAAVRCLVHQSGAIQLERSAMDGVCDVSALPDGAFSAVVHAFSFDEGALRSDPQRLPELPAVSVSEDRLAFIRGSPTYSLRTVPGAIETGAGKSLALFAGLRANGAASSADWTIEVTGPGIPSATPLSFAHRTGAAQSLFWSYSQPPAAGAYRVKARSGALLLSSSVWLGEADVALAAPEASSEARGSGAVEVSASAVAGAQSYHLTVIEKLSRQPVHESWSKDGRWSVSGLLSGGQYEAFVASSDVDMTQPSSPRSVAVAERSYSPHSFVAP